MTDDEIKQLEEENSVLRANVSNLTSQLKEANATIDNLKLDTATLKRQRDEFEDSFKTQMRKRMEDAQMVRLKAKRRNELEPEAPKIP